MSENLKVHPALVLVGALLALRLLGFIGILLAAPVLATLKLIFSYLMKKLIDEDPWEELDGEEPREPARWAVFLNAKWDRFKTWLPGFLQKVGTWIKTTVMKVLDFIRSKLKASQEKKKKRKNKANKG